MSTLSKYQDAEIQLEQERQADIQAAKVREQYHKKERKALYEEFVECIKPFNRQIIKKHKISLKFNDRKLEIQLFIDKKLHRTFIARTNYHMCNCSASYEGPCGHDGEYTHDIDAFSFDKKGVSKNEYFSWYGNDKESREYCFVKSFKELMEDYENDLVFGKDE
jgi:hypothetical protein